MESTTGIGSGIYTGKVTRRIRDLYGIDGTYDGDIVKGICCPACALIRNDREVRRREEEKHVCHTLSTVGEPYRRERPMSAAALGTRMKYVAQTVTWPDEGTSDRGNWDGAQELRDIRLERVAPPPNAHRNKANGPHAASDDPQDIFEPRDDRTSREATVLSPITEQVSEDTDAGNAARFVENNPFRAIRAALQTSPESTSQHASPQSSFGSEPDRGPMEPQGPPSSCYDGAGY